MPSYKLIYFNRKARGEASRYIFELAGVQYDDHRIETEQWKELKSKIGFGQLPILEIDGNQYPQSHAHYRHLAREFGLYGANNLER
ncbi:glutathione S-transferase N-terminal domain-containing protein, partial [Salmonella sp. s54395]|uniref:glutathione S-transferase N-terminal domain-containing protein n=1 Tax=Salmonella sp. s54395 TaxID=3159664 RepID=UPI00397FAE16